MTVEIRDRARAYAAATPVAISGSSGHAQTFALACSLTHGFALDEATALEIMREWNAGCMPPWSERELRHKVAQSQKVNHSKPRGHLLGRDGERLPVAPVSAPRPEKSVWKVARRQAATEKRPPQPSPEKTTSVGPMPSAVLVPANEKGIASIDTPGRRALTPEDWSALRAIDPPVTVPGCKIPRPSEIDVANEDWHALESVGLADDPLIQLTLVTFGPGCVVLEANSPSTVETGRVKPCVF